MPRKRNEEAIELAARCAWRIFGEKGYENTTYTDIAEASGINRATVQNYFPKKENIVALVHMRAIETARELAERELPNEQDPFALSYATVQVFYSTIMSSEEAQCCFRHVLSRRDMCREASLRGMDWLGEYIAGARPSLSEERLMEVVVANGQLDDAALYCMDYGLDLDIPLWSRPYMIAIAKAFGIRVGDAKRAMSRCEIPPARALALGRNAYAQLVGEDPKPTCRESVIANE